MGTVPTSVFEQPHSHRRFAVSALPDHRQELFLPGLLAQLGRWTFLAILALFLGHLVSPRS
jgi:hypothetical protein